MSSQAEWTWLVYMAGDNNLEGELMVGSEETEPGAGWPYTTILEKLT